jgi:putative endonuclease
LREGYYVLASISRVLYVGVTGFLVTRILQHKSGETDSFTCPYRVRRLVYYETFRYVNNAIVRETEIKKWRREKKVALIERENPTWEDLAAEWGKPAVMRNQIPPPSLRSASERQRVKWTWRARRGV